jgi:hypothetical protein
MEGTIYLFLFFCLSVAAGGGIAQAVSWWYLTIQAWVQSQVSSCKICGGQSGIGTGCCPSTSVLLCWHHSKRTSILTSQSFATDNILYNLHKCASLNKSPPLSHILGRSDAGNKDVQGLE